MRSPAVIGGGKGVKDGKGQKKKKHADEEEEEGETYYDAMKKDMGDRAARTKVNISLHMLLRCYCYNTPVWVSIYLSMLCVGSLRLL